MMKPEIHKCYRSILLFAAIQVMFYSTSIAQTPTLELTGSSPTFTPGTINTEVLTEIIQEKQEEVKEQVFRNTIVKSFQNGDWTKNLNNFATYHYMFNLMDEVTSGKNKTAITEGVLESSAEFSYVMGLALYLELEAYATMDTTDGLFSLSERVFESALVTYDDGIITTSDRIVYFNLLMDMCYDVVLNNTEYTNFDFSEDLNDESFMRWYNTDNVYIQALSATDDPVVSVEELQNLHDQVTEKYNALMQMGNAISDLKLSLGDIITNSDQTALQTIASTLLDELDAMGGEELKESLESFLSKYGVLLSTEQRSSITTATSSITEDFDSIKQIVYFFMGLAKSEYTDFSMTETQYNSMRYILTRFLNLAKNQFKNDVISTTIEFLLDNTLVEYASSGTNSDGETTGYLYIDVEAVISAIYSEFSEDGNKGYRAYVKPFISIGANYASFINENTLTTTETTPSSLWNLYYGSEKLGLKWKIWNWEYTHSFDAGQQFEYYGKSRYWLSPPTQPTISDVDFIVYGSGLLYNMVNLKSDENFNNPILGAGFGVTFFNGLNMNISLAAPFSRNQFKLENSFINFGFDIPIVEYISALSNN